METNSTKPEAKARFFVGRRSTRWDVYPQQEHEQACALDWHGFWAMTKDGQWFKSPSSYECVRDVTREQIESDNWRLENGVGNAFS